MGETAQGERENRPFWLIPWNRFSHGRLWSISPLNICLWLSKTPWLHKGKLWQNSERKIKRETDGLVINPWGCFIIFDESLFVEARRGKMDMRQRDKEKENEKDQALGDRTPKVSSVNREPPDIAGGWSDRAYGSVCSNVCTHLHFYILCSSSILSYGIGYWCFRYGSTEPRPWPVQESDCPWPSTGLTIVGFYGIWTSRSDSINGKLTLGIYNNYWHISISFWSTYESGQICTWEYIDV